MHWPFLSAVQRSFIRQLLHHLSQCKRTSNNEPGHSKIYWTTCVVLVLIYVDGKDTNQISWSVFLLYPYYFYPNPNPWPFFVVQDFWCSVYNLLVSMRSIIKKNLTNRCNYYIYSHKCTGIPKNYILKTKGMQLMSWSYFCMPFSQPPFSHKKWEGAFIIRGSIYNELPHDKTNKMSCAPRNDITTLVSCDRHGSDTVRSPQCNSWKVIHFSFIIWICKVCFGIFCNKTLIWYFFQTFKTTLPSSQHFIVVYKALFLLFTKNK